jgi:type I thyroxine 5'-deiodinase
VVYIAEAHPTDEWQVSANEDDGVLLTSHRDFEERKAAARRMSEEMGMTVPKLVDGMDNAAADTFAGWPERICVIDAQGRIAYPGKPGPWGFDPDEARKVLDEIVPPA